MTLPSSTTPPAAGMARLSCARRLARAHGGSINVEFAIIATVVAMLLIGAFDFGRLAMRYAEAQSVAKAGVQYAVQDKAKVSDPDDIAAAALAEATSDTLTVEVISYCQCAGGAQQACNVACPDGDYAPLYVSVVARDSLDLLFPYPGLDRTQAIAVSSVGRAH